MTRYEVTLTSTPGGILIEFPKHPTFTAYALSVAQAIEIAEDCLECIYPDLDPNYELEVTIYD